MKARNLLMLTALCAVLAMCMGDKAAEKAARQQAQAEARAARQAARQTQKAQQQQQRQQEKTAAKEKHKKALSANREEAKKEKMKVKVQLQIAKRYKKAEDLAAKTGKPLDSILANMQNSEGGKRLAKFAEDNNIAIDETADPDDLTKQLNELKTNPPASPPAGNSPPPASPPAATSAPPYAPPAATSAPPHQSAGGYSPVPSPAASQSYDPYSGGYTCEDSSACNYMDMGDCNYDCHYSGCDDMSACNYGDSSDCNYDCHYSGCDDMSACNYGDSSDCYYDCSNDDGYESYIYDYCSDPAASNYNEMGACSYDSNNYDNNYDYYYNPMGGSGGECTTGGLACAADCMDPTDPNYGTSMKCTYVEEYYRLSCEDWGMCDDSTVISCTHQYSSNYNSAAMFDDGSCDGFDYAAVVNYGNRTSGDYIGTLSPSDYSY